MMGENTYLTDEHRSFRELVRRFVSAEAAPHIEEWEAAGRIPRAFYRQAGELGLLGIGHPVEYGGTPGTDVFHLLTLTEELVTAGRSGGLAAALITTYIATPHIRDLGTPEQKERLLPRVIAGEWVAALAVTEPDTGSDVAAIRTRAVRCGDAYVVNGAKTFISCGGEADYVTTAVRTGQPGNRGVSLLVIPTDTAGFSVSRRLDKMGWRSCDTAELVFQDCEVPVANLLGRENEGFAAIMVNFQTERLMLATMAWAAAALALDEAIAYARTRTAFGGPLRDKQVIRHKLAEMATRVDAAREYVWRVAENLRRGVECSAQVAMAKNFAYEAASAVIDEAVQIHGGMGFMTGTVVERLYRDNRVLGIGGGTKEIMNEIIARRMEF